MLNKRTLIREISNKKIGTEVYLAGWVKKIKVLGKISFLTLTDVSGSIQVIALKENFKQFRELEKISNQSVISLKGTIKKSELKNADKEIEIKKLEILNLAESPLPIDLSGETTNIDKRIDHRFLDTRKEKVQAIFKIRSKTFKIITNFFDSNNFININTPKLTNMGVESGAELFKVKYFNQNVYLSQSPQIYKQMFVAGGFEKVYEIAPLFRAEKSHTTRHLTEFTGIDMEMGFIEDENDIMDVIEDLFKDLLTKLKKECKQELEILNIKIQVPKKIPRISMQKLKDMLAKKGKKLGKDDDLDADAEKLIGKYILNKFKEEFVFVTDYPYECRPFYHMKPKDNPKGTKSFDLLWNGLEIATGAQREHRYPLLKKQAKEKGVNLDSMGPYVEIFKFGCPPHGGIGLGLDRIIECLLKIDNIRKCILLPRDPDRLTP